jgi:copper(I)-binding protein
MRRLLLPVLLALPALPAVACELKLEDAWIRPAPPTAKVVAGFGRIVNPGTVDAELASLASPAFGRVELHEMKTVDGVMQMRRIDRVKLGPGESIELAPGGNHFMLFDPVAPLAEGDTVELTMTLACDTEITASLPVAKGPMAGPAGTHGGDAPHRHHH